MNCASCKFFHPINDTYGSCRRNPPIIFSSDWQGIWASVTTDAWCGEYKTSVAFVEERKKENGEKKNK